MGGRRPTECIFISHSLALATHLLGHRMRESERAVNRGERTTRFQPLIRSLCVSFFHVHNIRLILAGCAFLLLGLFMVKMHLIAVGNKKRE